MDSQERLKTRLDNVAAVEPILGALRSISLSSRLLTLQRVGMTERYVTGLGQVLAQARRALPAGAPELWPQRPAEKVILLVLGTERGLCGSLNELLAAEARAWLSRRQAQAPEVRLGVLGRAAEKALRRLRRAPVWSWRLPSRGLPPYDLAVRLSEEWLKEYQSDGLDAVYVIHGVRRGLAGYAITTSTLLPPALPVDAADDDLELPPIVEGDWSSLVQEALRLWLCAAFYGIMLRSAVAEHTARYQLLEGAVQNAHRLTEELSLQLQQARQEAITAELQDLMAGSGLIGAPVMANSARG